MPSTRSSARLAAQQSSSPTKPSPDSNSAGKKRKAETGSSPKAKRGRKGVDKDQKTIEETMDVEDNEKDDPEDIEMEEAADPGEGTDKKAGEQEQDINKPTPEALEEEAQIRKNREEEDKKVAEWKKQQEAKKQGTNGTSEGKGDNTERVKEDGQGANTAENDDVLTQDNIKDKSAESKPAENGGKEEETESKPANGTNGTNGAVQEDKKLEEKMPSTIMEKGIIYFFTRGRVGVDEPEGVEDIQRSHIVLRPLPIGAKLGDGKIQDMGNNRLIALPKKVLPQSKRDRFMVFVEKAKTTVQDLKDNYMKGSEYETKTQGTRVTPPATCIGEGVYALTTTGRESHLAYKLTIPSELGEVQKEMGIRSQGSFVTSLKNPTAKGPANASLDEAPEFPQEIMDEFRGLRWMPNRAEHLDYERAQFLLIGEEFDDINKALEPSSKDKRHDKEHPKEALEGLEHEDEIRVKHLAGDDSVFDDLELSKKDFPKVMTTWE